MSYIGRGSNKKVVTSDMSHTGRGTNPTELRKAKKKINKLTFYKNLNILFPQSHFHCFVGLGRKRSTMFVH